MRDKILLRQLQALPLDAKVLMTQQRIREWYNYWNGDVCVSFSGGKDSTVLAHLVHDMYPKVPLVFSNTGLEYPEIQSFARKMGAEFVRPKMSFPEVITKYGYPVISKEVAGAIFYARKIRNSDDSSGSGELRGRTGWRRANLTGNTPPPKKAMADANSEWKNWRRKVFTGENPNFTGGSQFNKTKWLPLCQETEFMISHYCCDVMKKSPMKIYQRKHKVKPFIGTLASESRMRTQAWIQHGCNAFEGKNNTSQPMSFWTEQDVLQYIKREGLEICSVYGEVLASDDTDMMYEPLPGVECNLKCTGCNRTGCIFCCFGVHLEKGETRFQALARTHPRQYEYCMNGGKWVDNPNYDPTAPEYDGKWKNWNPPKIWVPSKEGLGMKKVFDDCNKLYGKDFIRYE